MATVGGFKIEELKILRPRDKSFGLQYFFML